MKMHAKVTCIIPARLNSSRFPGKLLYLLEGKPVILHTVERALSAGCFDEVICFTDSPDIAEVVAGGGCRVVITPPAENGTERIAANLSSFQARLVINLQGDEPVFPVGELDRLSNELIKAPGQAHILFYSSYSKSAPNNANRVKAVVDQKGFAVDFVRTPREAEEYRSQNCILGIQHGIYGYSKEYLSAYAARTCSVRERSVSHELLRDMSIAPVRAHISEHAPTPLDVSDDLPAILRALKPLNQTTSCQPAF